jgi:predicted MFS family arabinose efflux permease
MSDPRRRFPPAFRWLFAAEMVSLFGSLVSRTALPLVAILFLDARPLAVALLGVADVAAGLLSALVLGTWVDRWDKRTTMRVADLGRALLLALVPLGAWMGWLSVPVLFAVALGCGVLDMAFSLAYAALLPRLVDAEALLAANSRIAAGQAVVEVGSFGIAGWLVQWFTAPVAVLVDALSFAGSFWLVGRARVERDVPAAADARPGFWAETRAGLALLRSDPVLRALAVVTACVEGGGWMFGSMFLFFLMRDLGLPAGPLGLVFAVGGLSAFAGASLAGRLAARWPAGPLMIAGLALSAAAMFLPAWATGASLATYALLIAQQLIGDGGAVVYQINDSVLRQTRVPAAALARVNAAIMAVGLAASLVGRLAGGFVAEAVNARSALVVAAAIVGLGALIAALSPLRRWRAP